MTITISPITSIFDNATVRFAEVDGEYLVSANDVMNQLGYADPKVAWYKMQPKIEALLGRVSKLDTLTKTGIYQMAYLTEEQLIAVFLKSNKEEAAPFFRWAVSVIKERINQIKTQQIRAEAAATIASEVAKQMAPVKDEAYYHNLILRYADYSTIKFRSEAIFDNTLPSEDNAKHRRTDLIRVLPKCVQVWELKAHPISEDDISRTIAAKGYLSLVAKRYPGKCIDFKFTSPYGITDSGTRLIELLGCSATYREINCDGIIYRCKVGYEPLQEIANRVQQNIIKSNPVNHAWYTTKFTNQGFEDILTYPTPKSNLIQFPVKKNIRFA